MQRFHSSTHSIRSMIFTHSRFFRRVGIVLIFVAFGAFVAAGVEIYFSQRIYPHVYFNTMSLGGKTIPEATALIRAETQSRLDSEVVYMLSDSQRVSLGKARDFASYDVDKTVLHAFSVGRNGSLWDQIKTQLWLVRYSVHIAPVYAYNRPAFEQSFNDVISSYEKPVINSSLQYTNGALSVTEAQEGVVADRDVVTGEFERFLAFQREHPEISIQVIPTQPEITVANSQPALLSAQKALTRELVLSTPQLPGSTWTLTKDQLARLMDLQKTESGVSPVITDYKVASWSAEIAQLVNRDPVDAKFEYDGNRVNQFEPGTPGLALDTIALTQRINERAFDQSQPNTVEIPLNVTSPALSTENVNTYGIKELVGTGHSKFKGSPAGRIHNLALASSKLNGVLIAPGEVFSMYKVVGEVEKSTGYQDAFIIKDGRTVPGVGGGLCQVSTTLFRAVLDAGLPVNERHQHAYRVYYYEQDSPPGIDAAVYFPSWDFKFTNDTDNYLLLQTKVDTKAMTAEFNLYGVKDGRTVTMTKPVLSNQAPPPPELRVDDPTLPRGQEKEVDHAVWGANTVFTRKVTKNGEEIINESFKSVYKPWQRVVMVGVKD